MCFRSRFRTMMSSAWKLHVRHATEALRFASTRSSTSSAVCTSRFSNWSKSVMFSRNLSSRKIACDAKRLGYAERVTQDFVRCRRWVFCREELKEPATCGRLGHVALLGSKVTAIDDNDPGGPKRGKDREQSRRSQFVSADKKRFKPLPKKALL